MSLIATGMGGVILLDGAVVEILVDFIFRISQYGKEESETSSP